MKNVQISEDGNIFRIQEDGTIQKIAKIDGNYRIVGNTSKDSNPLPWVLFVIVAIACIVIGILFSDTSSRFDRAQHELQNTKNSLSDERATVRKLRNDIESLKENLKSVGAKYPIIITDIQIANIYKGGEIETNYGSTIYSSTTMFLKPKITYKAISSGSITLYVKLFKPDGYLSTGSSSPSGYSFSHSININGDSSDVLLGWGSSTKGKWDSGTYRIEVWHKSTCLITKSFTIY